MPAPLAARWCRCWRVRRREARRGGHPVAAEAGGVLRAGGRTRATVSPRADARPGDHGGVPRATDPALAGDMLRVWDTARSAQECSRFAERRRGCWGRSEWRGWSCEYLPGLGADAGRREDGALPELSEGHAPRVVLETAQAGESLRVLPTLVYGDPAVARVDGERLVPFGKVLPRRDEAAEARRCGWCEAGAGCSARQRVVRAGGRGDRAGGRCEGRGAVELRGEAHHAFKKPGAAGREDRGPGSNLSFVTGDDGRPARRIRGR
jgi:hypothetical protein